MFVSFSVNNLKSNQSVPLEPGDSILFLTWCLASGGAERVTATLANELSKKYSVSIGLLLPKTIRTYWVSSLVKLYENVDANQMPKFIRKVVAEVRPKVIIGIPDMTEICLSGVMSRYPTVLSLRTTANESKALGGLKNMIHEAFRRFSYVKAAGVVFQTEQSREYYRKRVRLKSSFVIPNPVKAGLPKATRTANRIVTFCRLEPAKNLPLLVEAFEDFSATHSNYRLDIYGDGSERNELETLIAQKGLMQKAEIHPYTRNIHAAITDAKMYVSSSDYEGMSNSLLESMAMGIPSISTDSDGGGARSVIADGVNGLLVRKGNPAELSSAMSRIADDPSFAARLSAGGMRLAEDLSPQRIAEEWEDALISILQTRSGLR